MCCCCLAVWLAIKIPPREYPDWILPPILPNLTVAGWLPSTPSVVSRVVSGADYFKNLAAVDSAVLNLVENLRTVLSENKNENDTSSSFAFLIGADVYIMHIQTRSVKVILHRFGIERSGLSAVF
jgi:hypothetical protein